MVLWDASSVWKSGHETEKDRGPDQMLNRLRQTAGYGLSISKMKDQKKTGLCGLVLTSLNQSESAVLWCVMLSK